MTATNCLVNEHILDRLDVSANPYDMPRSRNGVLQRRRLFDGPADNRLHDFTELRRMGGRQEHARARRSRRAGLQTDITDRAVWIQQVPRARVDLENRLADTLVGRPHAAD